MTIQQAITHLEFLKVAGLLDANPNQIDNDALDMAINALKERLTEPCYQTTSCSDCKMYDKDNHNCPRFCEVIKELVDEARPTGEYQKRALDLIDSLEDADKITVRQVGTLRRAILAEPDRPTGKWARHDEWVGGVYVGGFYHVNCTCEDGYYSKWETNFCPNCGQPMKKGVEE